MDEEKIDNSNQDKIKILSVDDDKDVLQFLEKRLVRLGFIVKAISKPINIVASVKEFNPDIILLDLIMPHYDGLTLGEILNQDEDTRNIPIIIISALSKIEDVKKAYKIGVVGYFTKPIDFDKLVSEIYKTVSFKRKGGVK